MKKVLIVFATREGQTAKVAERIFEHFSRAGVVVELLDAKDGVRAESIELTSIDLLICGASMHAGELEAEILRFVERNAAQIASMQRSFFLVLLSAAAREPERRKKWLCDARKKMKRQLAVGFDDCEMVAGALVYSKYSKPIAWMMKRIAKLAGEATDTSKDYEFTDWDQVDRYALRLLDAMREPG